MTSRILLLDPDPRAFGDLPARLRADDCEVDIESEPERVDERLTRKAYDLALAESRQFGARWLAEAPAADLPPAILLDTFGRLRPPASHGPVVGVLARPIDPEQALHSVRRALREQRLERENAALRRADRPRFALGRLVSDDARMGSLFDLARRVASSRASVLIQGESGTGKTELARALHEASDRSSGPFVEVHCGALAENLLESELFGHAAGAFTGARVAREGKFEAADGGTLFLDELATAPLDLQIKLLRVLEQGRFERVGETATRAVDVRVVAATNEDLAALVRSGRFRQDLYWRVQVVVLEPPPLRDRPGDIPLLARRYLERYAEEHDQTPKPLSPRALGRCLAYDWPGNVRELCHALERAMLLCTGEEIEESALPESVRNGVPTAIVTDSIHGLAPDHRRESTAEEPRSLNPSPAPPIRLGPLPVLLAEAEREILERALEATGGHRRRTCELLGIGRSTLFEKLRKHGLGASVEGDGPSSHGPGGSA